MSNDPKIIIALDFSSEKEAIELAAKLDPGQCRLKVGKELFTAAGPDLVRRLQSKGFEIFLDLKFHDIPATVGKACAAARDLGVWMLNVHAIGGLEMMLAARAAIPEGKTKLIAVTVLTSMDNNDLLRIGLHTEVETQVKKMAALAAEAGLDGVVCSAKEASMLRKSHSGFLLVAPGIRPAWSASDDQKRIVTPADALKLGVDYLVIGRPVTKAPDPLAALVRIQREIDSC